MHALGDQAPDKSGDKPTKLKHKGWPRVQSVHLVPNLSPGDSDLSRQEAACNEVPHVFVPQRDQPFEGMSHGTGAYALCPGNVVVSGRCRRSKCRSRSTSWRMVAVLAILLVLVLVLFVVAGGIGV